MPARQLIRSLIIAKEALVGPDVLRRVERDIMLQLADGQWKDHLYSLDHLKDGIGLRGYGQRDPLVEYKKESFNLFQAMKDRIDEEMVRYLWRLRPVLQEPGSGDAPAPPPPPARPQPRKPPTLSYSGGSSSALITCPKRTRTCRTPCSCPRPTCPASRRRSSSICTG